MFPASRIEWLTGLTKYEIISISARAGLKANGAEEIQKRDKKIIVYNKNDCWTDLLTWIDKAKNMEMLRTIPKNLVIAENIDELIFALKSYV